MANLKTIAATLAILGSGALALGGCNKEKQTTEDPTAGGAGDAAAGDGATAGDAAAGDGAAAGEMKCGEGHTPEGHCGSQPAAEGGGETPPAE